MTVVCSYCDCNLRDPDAPRCDRCREYGAITPDTQEAEEERDATVVVRLHPMALEYLKELAEKGLYGIDVPGVAQRLIEDGLRRYLQDGSAL